jgi:hypothetical protein
MAFRLQEILHKYEVGAGAAVLRFITAAAAFLAVAVVFDLAAFRNLATRDAMDAAQVGRNVAEGRGFTTSFIRPLSLYLLTKQGGNESSNTLPAVDRHPDLANPPVYPGLLALAWKTKPFPVEDLSKKQNFSVYFPDLWITIWNQVLLGLAAWLVFVLAKRLFDSSVAWASFALLVLSETYWKFSVSGLSTVLLIVEFLLLILIISRLEAAARVAVPGRNSVIAFAALAGALVGFMAMTRYSFACLIVPLIILVATLPSMQRPTLVVATLATFMVVCAPWVVRNFQLSGTPFGTAGFAIMAGTSNFPEDQLERSLHPLIRQVEAGEYWQKLFTNLHDIVVSDLWRLGGGWIMALFLVGLLVPFRNPVLGRTRLFLVLTMLALCLAQALARTSASVESPDINAENLLVVVGPAILMFGISLFVLLREQLNLGGPAGKNLLWAVLYILVGAPFLLAVIGSHPSRLVYPPYYPPWIQQKSAASAPGGAIMADVPWAVAWYGDRPSIWLSLKYIDRLSPQVREDFGTVAKLQPIKGFYLSSKALKTLDVKDLAAWSQSKAPDSQLELVQKMVTELGQRLVEQDAKPDEVERLRAIYKVVERNWVQGGGDDWESFILGIFVKKEVPTGFPLQKAVGGIVPEIFLTELSERK